MGNNPHFKIKPTQDFNSSIPLQSIFLDSKYILNLSMHQLEVYNFESNTDTHVGRAELTCLVDFAALNTRIVRKSMKNNMEFTLKALVRDDARQGWLEDYFHLIFIIDSESMNMKEDYMLRVFTFDGVNLTLFRSIKIPTRSQYVKAFNDFIIISEENKIQYFKIHELMDFEKEPVLVKVLTGVENTQFKRIEYQNGYLITLTDTNYQNYEDCSAQNNYKSFLIIQDMFEKRICKEQIKESEAQIIQDVIVMDIFEAILIQKVMRADGRGVITLCNFKYHEYFDFQVEKEFPMYSRLDFHVFQEPVHLDKNQILFGFGRESQISIQYFYIDKTEWRLKINHFRSQISKNENEIFGFVDFDQWPSTNKLAALDQFGCTNIIYNLLPNRLLNSEDDGETTTLGTMIKSSFMNFKNQFSSEKHESLVMKPINFSQDPLVEILKQIDIKSYFMQQARIN